jgi:hypothetical protein
LMPFEHLATRAPGEPLFRHDPGAEEAFVSWH